MNYYNDPTASAALGNINREFSKQVKKAQKIRKLYEEGKLSQDALQKAQCQFKGIYKHVLDNVFKEEHN